MDIDFHFGVTYVVSRLAGLSHQEAETVATSSQYVDDTVNRGTLEFKSGQAYSRMITAHNFVDYHLFLPTEERLAWVPFHFIPGNDLTGPASTKFYNQIICRPNSRVAQEMLKACILKKGRSLDLHLLGITAHVFVDTWAHQGFAGIKHKVNVVEKINLEENGDKRNRHNFVKELFLDSGGISLVKHYVRLLIVKIFDRWFPMGHGAALHYPDQPFRKWSYVNGHGQKIVRDNPSDFTEAADELCKFIQRFIAGNPEVTVLGLKQNDKDRIRQMLTEIKDEDPVVRNEKWVLAVKENIFNFGAAEISYASYGKKSWKYKAYGLLKPKALCWQKFEYKESFLKSDWKLFHDAAREHQLSVIHETLPKFNICVI